MKDLGLFNGAAFGKLQNQAARLLLAMICHVAVGARGE